MAVATFAFDSSDAQDASRQPISLHPAFPAIVALWFAALLGIGSLVLPAVLLERFVTMTGLAAVFPAAGPPFDFLARGLIALGAALAGAVAGVAIARRVARAHDERPSRAAKFSAGARRPIRVNEELGGEGLVNGRALPVTRRRALAIAEDERPSDFLYTAPLPGNCEDEHELALDAVPPAPAVPEPLELCDPLEDSVESGIAAHFDAPDSAYPDEDEPMTFKQEFQPFEPISQAGTQAEDAIAEDEDLTDEAKPLPFAAPSLARRAPHAANEPLLAAPQPVIPEEPRFRGDWAEAPVTDLGLVQLVQRLGASLERRRERAARAATAAPAPALAPPPGFDAAPAEEAAQAMAAYFGKPAASAPVADTGGDDEANPEPIMQQVPLAAAEPASPAPHPGVLHAWPAEDDEDGLDAAPSFTLPLRRKPVVPTIAFDVPGERQPVEDEDEAAEDDDGYSSLLAMRNPFSAKESGFVRVDEPEPEAGAAEPTVVFPGREDQRLFDQPGKVAARPADAPQLPLAGTDAALRAALSTLQRMSGNA